MRILPSLALVAALAWAPSAYAIDLPAGGGAGAGSEPEAPKTAPGDLPPSVAPMKDLPRVELHGGAYFWYYQPIKPESIEGAPESNLELYLASLEFTGRLHDFGLFLNPRFRDSAAREFFTSNVWVEEAYAFWEQTHLTIKAGKIYRQFSRLWDDTFYGSLPYFDGFKLDSNYGISLEGFADTKSGFGIGYYGQYFLVDGGTNGSLRDRDTVWVGDDVNRRHTTVLRVEPSYRFNDKASLRLGLAGEYSYVDFETVRPSHVFRFSGDLSFVYTPLKIFGEFITQTGQTVTEYPFASQPAVGAEPAKPGRASQHNHYVVAGAEVQVWRVTARYSFSLVNYRDFPVMETLHVPGLTVALHDNVSLMFEYAYWERSDPDGKTATLDNSFNAIIYARF